MKILKFSIYDEFWNYVGYNIASDDSKLGLFILFNIKTNWSVATTVPLLEAYKHM
jgi:hypothetical protein